MSVIDIFFINCKGYTAFYYASVKSLFRTVQNIVYDHVFKSIDVKRPTSLQNVKFYSRVSRIISRLALPDIC